MAFDQYLPSITAGMTLVGLLFVAWQMRTSTKQRQSESFVKLYDINRELISLGFSHPILFKVLADEKVVDPVAQSRYLQLWLNQLALSFSYLQETVSHPELKESLHRNLVDFMTMKNMQQHWKEFGIFYPASFQKCVNDILKKVEPPKAAHVKPN